MASANASASHGSANTLKVRLPRIDGDRRPGVLAPQLERAEAHRVEPLRVLFAGDRMDVGIHVRAVHALDAADMAADVTRQPRMRARMRVARAYPVADGERPRPHRLARDAAAAHQQRLDPLGGKGPDVAGGVDRMPRPRARPPTAGRA